MISVDQNRFVFPAWGVSLTLHGLVVGVVFLLAAQVKPVLEENLFQWDVALIESTSPTSKAEPFEPVQTPESLPAKKVITARTTSVPDVPQPVMAVTPVERKIEQVPLSEEKVEVAQQEQQPMEQGIVETVPPPAEPSVGVTEPSPQPVQEEPVSVASAPIMASDVVRPEETPVSAAPSRSEETPPAQVAKTSPSGSEMKADHRWLAELLWRRVAELKRYPSSARISGQEGKVILKAVIRSDGHLADVAIQRSSGHELLDAAAIEAVKLACPLHMKHALDKPQIVVSLPIVYSLLTP